MKRKQFFFILSTCLALSAYSPVSAAEATFSSFEEDETFVSEDEDSFRDENYDIIDDENDGYNFVDSEECGETEQAEIFADEADTGYKIVKNGVPIEFKYDGTTLYFRLTEGATEGKLPDWGSVAGAMWCRGTLQTSAQNVTKIVIGEGITAIGKNNFCKGGNKLFENLTEVDVPSTLSEIGFGAFQNDTKLVKFDFNNIKSIGSVAFAGTGFTDVTIPSDGVIFGSNAFYNCKNLSSVSIGDSELSDGIFSDCNSLADIHYASKLVNIPANAFQRTALSSFNFDGVESIGKTAFQGTKLETISLPNVKDISSYAFLGSSVKKISFGNAEINVAEDAFSNCNDLTAICYVGSREQWKNLAISASVSENVQIHCKADSVEPKVATCTETGLKEVGVCEVCGDHYSYADDENVLPVDTVNGHNWSEDYVVDRKQPAQSQVPRVNIVQEKAAMQKMIPRKSKLSDMIMFPK